MQRSSIFTALSILALGSLAACNKDRPATEVPAASDAALEDETEEMSAVDDSDDGNDLEETGVGEGESDESTADDDASETASGSPSAPSEPLAAADNPAEDETVEAAPAAAKPKKKPKPKPKKKAKRKTAKKRASKGEAACGEGTCA